MASSAKLSAPARKASSPEASTPVCIASVSPTVLEQVPRDEADLNGTVPVSSGGTAVASSGEAQRIIAAEVWKRPITTSTQTTQPSESIIASRAASPEHEPPGPQQRRAEPSKVASGQRPTLDCGKRKPHPTTRFMVVMTALLKTLDAEYQHVYQHNLGMESGTAVIEDLIVRRVHALCKKAQVLLVTHDGCADLMLSVCLQLTPMQLNRLQTIFDSFGMTEVTDSIRLQLFDRQTISTAAVMPDSENACVLQLEMPRHKSCAALLGGLSRAVTAAAPKELQVAVVGEGTLPPPPPALRFSRLEESGHAFIALANRMLQARRFKAQISQAGCGPERVEFELSRLIRDGDTSAGSLALFHVLKHYPALRKEWLAGTPLLSLINNRHGSDEKEPTLSAIDHLQQQAAIGAWQDAAQSRPGSAKGHETGFAAWGGDDSRSARDRVVRVQDSCLDTSVFFITQKPWHDLPSPKAEHV